MVGLGRVGKVYPPREALVTLSLRPSKITGIVHLRDLHALWDGTSSSKVLLVLGKPQATLNQCGDASWKQSSAGLGFHSPWVSITSLTSPTSSLAMSSAAC